MNERTNEKTNKQTKRAIQISLLYYTVSHFFLEFVDLKHTCQSVTFLVANTTVGSRAINIHIMVFKEKSECV